MEGGLLLLGGLVPHYMSWHFVIIVNGFQPKMPKFGHLASKIFTTNDKFEISTFKIGYMLNLES